MPLLPSAAHRWAASVSLVEADLDWAAALLSFTLLLPSHGFRAGSGIFHQRGSGSELWWKSGGLCVLQIHASFLDQLGFLFGLMLASSLVCWGILSVLSEKFSLNFFRAHPPCFSCQGESGGLRAFLCGNQKSRYHVLPLFLHQSCQKFIYLISSFKKTKFFLC